MSGRVSVDELSKHNNPDDLWIVVNGKVYDLSKFAPEHPGGPDGKDGSETYNQYHAADLIERSLSDAEKKGVLDEPTVTKEWKDAQQQSSVTQSDPEQKPLLETIINLNDFEQAFNKFGAQKANAYISGASNDLLTLNANKSYWQKLWFRPRIMRNVSTINTEMTMLGQKVKMPVWICPMGIAKVAGPEGETALAAGAAASGIIHCTSVTASYGLEDILAAAPNNPFFYQLYVDKQRHKSEEILKKIEMHNQIKALFVTVDLAVVSKREADERIRTQEVTSLYLSGEKNKVDKKGGGLARTTGSFIDWALSWDDLAWLRKHTKLPIVVKGIQSAADAKLAMQLGCQGIVVSNHGGRALDNAPATILVLLEMRRDCPEVFEKIEVFVDGGVRRGSDILKAVCLGARGVGVGRPFQCSVMYNKEGVESCAEILQDELETAMRLCGVTNLEKARGDMSYLNTSEIEQYLPKPQVRSLFSGWFRSRL
ncbi:hypothetical protein LTR78_009384 [Recurvomyces mirabilis]|uniref:L-lactate dehydrogenase (cytochrome) n=1 Tax=Recurvomyces mirabilis TaxID=574656 RepID=A0AAE0TRT6_9PEZI|nr:hypothetical protein LTR78_009384 [Recurvomyces mirabilis]KAK5154327.1 hypothetical protein LTS14_007012 [Recurvomyces mirabilis]